MFKVFGRVPGQMPLEQQLLVFSSYGIKLNPGRTIEELLISLERDEYESDPFLTLAAMLGSEVETQPSPGEFSDQLWNLDTECIEDHGDYAFIADRMRKLAGGTLPLQNIRDHVDIENDDVWLEVELYGAVRRFEPEVDNDWIDPLVLSWFVQLLATYTDKLRYTYLDLGGQSCLIGCASKKQFKGLRKSTGLDWQWLS